LELVGHHGKLLAIHSYFLSMLEGVAYSTKVCHPIRRKAATQSMAKLPLNPQESCHPIHGKAATKSTGKLPPNPRQGCHPWRVPLAPIGAKRRRASTVLL